MYSYYTFRTSTHIHIHTYIIYVYTCVCTYIGLLVRVLAKVTGIWDACSPPSQHRHVGLRVTKPRDVCVCGSVRNHHEVELRPRRFTFFLCFRFYALRRQKVLNPTVPSTVVLPSLDGLLSAHKHPSRTLQNLTRVTMSREL